MICKRNEHEIFLITILLNPTSIFETKKGPKVSVSNIKDIKWLQLDSNPQLSLKTNTQPFSQTGKMIELCCEYLSVHCIWLCAQRSMSKEFLDIQATIECGFTLNCIHDIIRTYNQRYCFLQVLRNYVDQKFSLDFLKRSV